MPLSRMHAKIEDGLSTKTLIAIYLANQVLNFISNYNFATNLTNPPLANTYVSSPIQFHKDSPP